MTQDQIRDNIRNGIACPDCGDHECSEVPFDLSKSVIPIWGCHACRRWGYLAEFKTPDTHISDRCHACPLDCRVAFPACESVLSPPRGTIIRKGEMK